MADQAGPLSWREWASEPPPTHWPTDVGSHIRSLVVDARLQTPPVLRIGPTRLPVLGRTRIYVCGITPYDTTHLGHAATFVWADLAARVFRLGGVDAEVCRNITDVDDHLLAQARAQQVGWRSLATEQTYRFEHDMDELGVARPAYEPRSFDHVDDVIALATELVASGAAYARAGNVYFRGGEVRQHAGLSRLEALELAAARGGDQDDPDKDDPLDVAVWRRSAEDEPRWPSPWGYGRPGWHAECAAMAVATLGPSLELHVGGSDLAFPHHAYEAALAEAFTGVRPFARSWLHVGTVLVGGQKMAKSTGNLVFVHDLLDRYGPAPVRLLLLRRRWDEPWDFDEEDLRRAASDLDHLLSASARPGNSHSTAEQVVASLMDDLDIPRALAVAAEVGGQPLRALLGLLGLT